MNHGLITMWRTLLCIPLCAVWVVLSLLILAGWGEKGLEAFILNWNKFVEEGPFEL